MKQKIKAIVKNNRVLRTVAMRLLKLKVRMRRPIVGKNNVVINQGVLYRVRYDIIGDNNRIEILKGAVLSNMFIFMRGNNHLLKIGEHCEFKGGNVWFEDHHGQIEIGGGTTIESAHIAVTEPHKKIIIGEDCMLSQSIELRTGDSHSILDDKTKKRINPAQDIFIENHVWIGTHSTILKGVHIKSNAIIGAHSLVTKDVPRNSLAAGIPAKVIKTDINWTRERSYE